MVDIRKVDGRVTKLVTPTERRTRGFSFSLKPRPIADASEHGEGFPQCTGVVSPRESGFCTMACIPLEHFEKQVEPGILYF